MNDDDCPLTIGSMSMREFFDLCLIQFARNRTVDKLCRVDPFEARGELHKCIALECFFQVGVFSRTDGPLMGHRALIVRCFHDHRFTLEDATTRLIALAEMNRQAGMIDANSQHPRS